MRVFVDANTLISGIVFRGNEHQFLAKGVTKKIQLVTSEDVLDEVVSVLNSKFPKQSGLVKEFLRLIQMRVVTRRDYEGSVKTGVVRDTSDAHVLAAALEAKCGVIVTGDRDLLEMGEYCGIEIKTSVQMLKRV